MPIQSIAFVGLGAMGLPMAANLARRQFRVTGFDRRVEALRALESAGGRSAASAAEAARGADALVIMVVNVDQANAVLFDDGAAAALAPGALVLLMATCAPAVVAALDERLAATGLRLLDAPVSGGVRGATEGTLTIMCGGPDETLAAARPLLDAMGDKIIHAGPKPGQGAAVKTVNQLLAGVHIAACAEAVALLEKSGLDAAAMLRVYARSAAGSFMLADRGPRMFEADPPVASAVDIWLKDFAIVLDAGRATRAALPLTAAAHQMFLAASAMGLGAKDDSHVVEVYRAMAGLAKA